MVLAYPLIGQWIGWQIGDGRQVRVGEDPWTGAGENFKLSTPLVQHLRSSRIVTLADACRDPRIRGRSQWKNGQDLGIVGELAEEWSRFFNLLVTSHIHLGSSPNKLVWTKNPNTKQSTAKLGYQAAMIEQAVGGEIQWWRKNLWQIQSPLKTIITKWLAISNKLFAWEMLQKHGFEGPRFFPLCRASDETSSHLFASCPYAGSVWNGVVGKLEADKAHEANATLEERTKAWWNDKRVGPFEAFPILFVYSIWVAKNKAIFNNTWIPPNIVISLLMSKIQEHKRDQVIFRTRIIRDPVINREMPWAFFDGES